MKSSTAHKKVRSKSRKSQQGKKRRASTSRKASRRLAPAGGMAAFISQGVSVDVDVLPEWKDLVPKNRKFRSATAVRKKVDTIFDKISTAQFAAVLLISALAIGLYVRHVFATQDTLSQLELLRRENLQLQLQHNQLKGAVDHDLSPNLIYRRAKELGLEPGAEFATPIRIKPLED